MSLLPANWVRAPIGILCKLKNGRAFKPTEWSQDGLPIVRIQNLNNSSASFNRFNGAYDKMHYLSGGELLFAWSGTPGTSFGAHVWRGGEALLNQHIFRVDFADALLDRRFFRHAINQKLTELISVAHGGAGLQHVTKGVFEGTEVALPPREEQKRIADKLDTVLTSVDAVNIRLARVASILRRFRQSVLAAATSGRLTEDWRLLNSKSKPWRKATLGDLIEEMRNGLAAKPDENPEGRKILRISAVRPGFLDKNDHRYLETDESSAKLYELRKGDLLFTRYNGSLEYVGVCAMVSEDLPRYVYPDKLIRVRTKTDVALPKFIELVSSAAEARQQIEGYVKSSAGQKGISGGNLKTLRIAVPPVEEQNEIVRQVETLFAFADRLEARLQTAQIATERLTPALLAKAFRGELVPQDPTDEPASELLRRLQQEAPSTSTKRGRKGAV